MIIDLLTMPAVILILGAFILSVIPKQVRSATFIVFPLLALVSIWSVPNGFSLTVPLGEYELILVQLDALSRVFATIFAMVAVIGGIYAYHIDDLTQQTSALIYAGGALGVAMAGDYFTFYVFWELMAVSSAYLIWARRTKETDAVGMRYLLVHIFGGSILLSGIIWHVTESGSLAITHFPDEYTVASVLMLIGISINAAIPPLHAWLADAYPKATITGAVFMSAFTTKSAVYVLIRMYSGWELLAYAGVVMALYGVVYAVLANDIRQILAYHIVSQVGYMVAGIGIGTEMAINGTTAHAFSHILYKSLLFMGAGAVLYATGKSKLTELGGFASKMKVVVFLYMIGALSISGFPLFNGFISKSMVVSAAGYAHFETIQLLLILASVGTFLHTGLKLPYFTWFGESKSEITVKPVPVNMIVAMGIGAFFCTLFGVYPDLLYTYLPYGVDWEPYTVYHLVEMTQILIFTFIGFWLFRKKLEGDNKIALDTDWFYRKPADYVRFLFIDVTAILFNIAEKLVNKATAAVNNAFKNPVQWIHPIHDEDTDTSSHIPDIGSVVGFVIFTVTLFVLSWIVMW